MERKAVAGETVSMAIVVGITGMGAWDKVSWRLRHTCDSETFEALVRGLEPWLTCGSEPWSHVGVWFWWRLSVT